MIRLPPRSTRTDTLFPYTTLFRSLPNRIAFSERLDGPEADGQAMLETAILVADLDRFSRINDSLGHLAGDELLATIARRLLSAMREGDVLARIRGDVFGVIRPVQRSVGKGCCSTCRYRWWPAREKQKTTH